MAALTAFYNNFEGHGSSGQFNYVSSENAIHCSFGDTAHLFGSPGMSWVGAASFFALDHASILNDLAIDVVESPSEEDLLLGGDASEFLQQQLNGSSNSSSSQTSLTTPENFQSFDHEALYEIGDECRHEELADSPQTCVSDESGLTTQDVVTVAVESEYFDEDEIKYEPPPLNNKRLEKIEDPDESIEAAEVSLDLIQNRRPYQCGQAGCNKTFKNPQTMKMHHKTHYTDGSAVDGLLPTLTASFTNNQSFKNSNNNHSKPLQNKKIPSRCPKCRKTFVGLYELRRHYGRKHSEGEKPFGCRKCEKRFYIEVDVRDHEKLCGEPIECKCGLKFAFKCNLVAHKKAHPACQHGELHGRHRHSTIPTISTVSTISSKSSKSSASTTASSKRRRDETTNTHDSSDCNDSNDSTSITSLYLAAFAAPPPDFQWLPEAKAARYDFDFSCADESPNLWSSGQNVHHPSIADFVNSAWPSPTSFSVFDSLVGHSQSLLPRKQELCDPAFDLLQLQSKLNALHGSVAH